MWFGCEDMPFWSKVRIMSIVAFGPVWVVEAEGEGEAGGIVDLIFEEDLEEVVFAVLVLEDFSRVLWSLAGVVEV